MLASRVVAALIAPDTGPCSSATRTTQLERSVSARGRHQPARAHADLEEMFNGYSWQSRTLEVRPDRLPPDFDAGMSLSASISGSSAGSFTLGPSPLHAMPYVPPSMEDPVPSPMGSMFGIGERPRVPSASGRTLFVGNVRHSCRASRTAWIAHRASRYSCRFTASGRISRIFSGRPVLSCVPTSCSARTAAREATARFRSRMTRTPRTRSICSTGKCRGRARHGVADSCASGTSLTAGRSRCITTSTRARTRPRR